MRRWLALACWLAFIAASIGGLHRLGEWFPLDLILDGGGPLEPALAAGFRLAGLVAGYWLAGSTILYVIARVGRIPGAIRAVEWATVGPVRRLIDGMVAGALVATIGLPGNAGAMVSSGYVPVPAGDPAPTTTTSQVPEVPNPDSESVFPDAMFLPIQATPDPPFDESPSIVPPLTVPNGPTEIVVGPGDHMWSLAEQRLTVVRGRQVSDIEIAPYWLQVVGTNLSRIRSGDPDLIFPGEVLVLPPVDP
jgi:hypothetical protein